MLIDHVHFYVNNARKTCDFLAQTMGFQSISQGQNANTYTEVMTNYGHFFFIISSPLNTSSPVAHYLKYHAQGVIDIAFKVDNLDAILQNTCHQGLTLIDSPETYHIKQGKIEIAKVKGWHSLEHTLVENTTHLPTYLFLQHLTSDAVNLVKLPNQTFNVDILEQLAIEINNQDNSKINSPSWQNNLTTIDHIVLNVAKGDLGEAAKFYQTLFDFQYQDKFQIQTPKSGLYSEVFTSPKNHFYLNINEPTSANSQIQQFVDNNGGAGIQHIALASTNLIKTVKQMRQHGLSFLSVSSLYYQYLKQGKRQGFIPSLQQEEWQGIEEEGILVDFDKRKPDSLLMQIFTQFIFDEATFFFECIERRKQAKGFGEGNFQTLFELIEQKQVSSQ